jgi:hypothetical protein
LYRLQDLITSGDPKVAESTTAVFGSENCPLYCVFVSETLATVTMTGAVVAFKNEESSFSG